MSTKDAYPETGAQNDTIVSAPNVGYHSSSPCGSVDYPGEALPHGHDVQLLHVHQQQQFDDYRDRDHMPPVPLPETSPFHLDVDYDTKAAYQSLDNLPSAERNYENMDDFPSKCPCMREGKCVGKQASPSHSGKLVCLVFFLFVIALLVGLGGLGVALYDFLTTEVFETSSKSETSSESENQQVDFMGLMERLEVIQGELNASMVMITELQALVADLQHDLNETNAASNERFEDLADQVNNISVVLADVVNMPTEITEAPPLPTFQEVELYENCTTTQVSGTVETDLFGVSYSLGETPRIPLNVEGMFNVDLRCAITDRRDEDLNPMIATLNIDQIANEIQCLCFVIAAEPRESAVDCKLFVTRCPLN